MRRVPVRHPVAEIARHVVSCSRIADRKCTPTKWRKIYNTTVRGILYKLGRRKGRLPFCFGVRAGVHEWLLDVIWWKESYGVELAVESALEPPEGVSDDFKRLLVIKSPLKLLIFHASTPARAAHVVNKLEDEHMKSFGQYQRDELYAVYAFLPKGQGDPVWTFQAPQDGRLPRAMTRSGTRLFNPFCIARCDRDGPRLLAPGAAFPANDSQE